MEARSPRRPGRARWNAALLLVVIALIVLIVAAPAMAKHAPHVTPHGAALSTPAVIAVLAVAVIGAVALVLFVVLGSHRERRAETSTFETPERVHNADRRSLAA